MPQTLLPVVALDGVTLSALQEVALLSPSRRGALGGCFACKQPIVQHFDFEAGVFLGCTHAREDTVFVLVPMPGSKGGTNHTPQRRATDRQDDARGVVALTLPAAPAHAPAPVKRARKAASKGKPRERRFLRARYFAIADKNAPGVADSTQRVKVLAAISHAGEAGALTRDIIKRSKLTNSAVSQALHWLQAHKVVDARPDNESRPRPLLPHRI